MWGCYPPTTFTVIDHTHTTLFLVLCLFIFAILEILPLCLDKQEKQISKTSLFPSQPSISLACYMLYLLLCGQLESRATREAGAGVPTYHLVPNGSWVAVYVCGWLCMA